MDINYLLEREQISLMKAGSAKTVEARIAHEGLARGYAAQLRQVAFPKKMVGIFRAAADVL